MWHSIQHLSLIFFFPRVSSSCTIAHSSPPTWTHFLYLFCVLFFPHHIALIILPHFMIHLYPTDTYTFYRNSTSAIIAINFVGSILTRINSLNVENSLALIWNYNRWCSYRSNSLSNSQSMRTWVAMPFLHIACSPESLPIFSLPQKGTVQLKNRESENIRHTVETHRMALYFSLSSSFCRTLL